MTIAQVAATMRQMAVEMEKACARVATLHRARPWDVAVRDVHARAQMGLIDEMISDAMEVRVRCICLQDSDSCSAMGAARVRLRAPLGTALDLPARESAL